MGVVAEALLLPLFTVLNSILGAGLTALLHYVRVFTLLLRQLKYRLHHLKSMGYDRSLQSTKATT